MRLQLGWLGRRLFEGALRRLLENAPVPVTVFFQVGSIKGRVIVDSTM